MALLFVPLKCGTEPCLGEARSSASATPDGRVRLAWLYADAIAGLQQISPRVSESARQGGAQPL